ncbi:MAG: choice-of-anchor I family protein [Parvularculaceae bacterium]
MIKRRLFAAASAATLALTSTVAFAAPATIEFLGRYESGAEEGAEISAFDPVTRRLFVTNGATGMIDIVDMSNPVSPAFVSSLALGGAPTHVAVAGRTLAVAVNRNDGASPGEVRFYTTAGAFQSAVEVGFLPDQVTLLNGGRLALVANEGEPRGTLDPAGTITVIDRSNERRTRVCTAGFAGIGAGDLDATTRLFPGKTPETDFEPEYVVGIDGSRTAYAVLQEANAIAEIDTVTCAVNAVRGLGYKDHSVDGNGIDASDRDDAINIATWPVFGIYMPDTIAAFAQNGETFIVTANEGDARDEDVRVEDLALDVNAFPNAADLQEREALGRLEVSTIDGDENGDGFYEALFAYGARSFSIYKSTGEQVFDSGDDFEQITKAALPDNFNASNNDSEFDARSDAKGPEPEGLAIGMVGAQRLAFIGLERIGGVMVYDITNPSAPAFCSYVNSRDFSVEEVAFDTDLGPEGIVFVNGDRSPTRKPLIFVTNEISGTVGAFTVSGGRCDGGSPEAAR